ncbi:MAG: cyclic nucleotide-binding domain-containing protein [Candidatus Promineifilaceae bacterium]|nr:cyclic nucleotide-binding domain-containing protein [Candidatus Promineifilaceae bacterium]
MSLRDLFKKVHLFSGLDADDLERLGEIAVWGEAEPGDILIRQNTTGTEMYVIASGSVQVFIEGFADEQSLVVLGRGQVVGEMTLVDHGYRSASVRVTEEGCTYYRIEREDIDALCTEREHIGYAIMRNLASDLAFKLRHRNLAAM